MEVDWYLIMSIINLYNIIPDKDCPYDLYTYYTIFVNIFNVYFETEYITSVLKGTSMNIYIKLKEWLL